MQVHAEETELRELGDHLAREDALLEPVSDLGQDLLADELPHGVADRLLLLVEERVDREEVEWVESGRGGGRGHGKGPPEVERVTLKIYRKCARAETPGPSGRGRTPPVACARDRDRDPEALGQPRVGECLRHGAGRAHDARPGAGARGSSTRGAPPGGAS